MQFKVVNPLPEGLKDVFANFKHIGVVERAYGDNIKHSPFAKILRDETLVDVKSLVSKVTGRPVSLKEIKVKINEMLVG